jgi:type VII secretion-associated serine protease mycosin
MIGRALAGAAAVLALVGTTATPAAADSIRNREWQLSDLKITDAHRISRGLGVTVALIDTGVDAGHRDLAGAVLAGYNTHHGPGNDSTGRTDLDGHGTNMAGIIAGRGHGSGNGILGIAPAAKILPISAPINGSSSSTFMTEAVDFAIAHHAGVINMSFGSAGDDTMHEAILKAQAADIVLVAAAGNRNEPGEYPGKYPEVLTVGSYGRNHKIASYSITGPQVDLTAPGDQIPTTGVDNSAYLLTSGTSGAAAVVSGAAALIRAKFPKLGAAEVVHRLTATADDSGSPGRDDSYGFGRLDVLKALTADVTPLPANSEPTASSSMAAAGPAPTAGVDTSDLPKAASPLLLLAVLAVLVVVACAVVVAILLRRRRERV